MSPSPPKYQLYCVGAFESASYRFHPYIAAPILVASDDGETFVKVNYDISASCAGIASWELTSQAGAIRDMSLMRARYVMCEPFVWSMDKVVVVTSATSVIPYSPDQRLSDLARAVLGDCSRLTYSLRAMRLLFDAWRSRAEQNSMLEQRKAATNEALSDGGGTRTTYEDH